jgi:hypothetical protein
MLYRHDETTGHSGPCDAFDLCDDCLAAYDAARVARHAERVHHTRERGVP